MQNNKVYTNRIIFYHTIYETVLGSFNCRISYFSTSKHYLHVYQTGGKGFQEYCGTDSIQC